MTEFVKRLRDDVEPTRTALAMAEAVHQHIEDVLTDDPGEPEDDPFWRDAERFADALTRALRRLTEGRQS